MEVYRMMKTDSPYLAHLRSVMEEVGITWCYGNHTAQDIGFERMQAQLATIATSIQKAAGDKAAQNFREVVNVLTQEQTSFVFEYLNNMGKIAVAHGLLMESRRQAIENRVAFDPVAALRPMSQAINEAVGGLNFTQYSWYTPQVRQLGNFLLFSLQWTMGAWNAAGGSMLTGKLFDTHMTPEAEAFTFKRRIPTMALLVLGLQPLVWQAGLYAIAKLAGGADDPDDTPWMWENEEGKRSAVDVTPFARLWPWYKGDKTGKRRTYMRWGKQLHEIQAWYDDPVKSLQGKSSLIVQTAYGLMAEKSIGTDIRLGFANTGIAGWVSGRDGFSDSRLWYIGQRFIPVAGTFSIGGAIRNPDAGFAPLFASVSRGMGYKRATTEAQEILRAWVQESDYQHLRVNQKSRVNLQELLGEVLDAAHRNGYPPDKVLKAAITGVIGRSYEKFYLALDKGDTDEVEEAAKEILRLNGTVQALRSSVRNRNNMYGKPMALTPEQVKAIDQAFQVPPDVSAREARKAEQLEAKRARKPTLAKQVAELNEYVRTLEKSK
jgi:hypothetical protein